MLKLSRNLLDSMDRFVLDRSAQNRGRHSEQPSAPRRGHQGSSRERESEYAELVRS
jgi:hypothetical protein